MGLGGGAKAGLLTFLGLTQFVLALNIAEVLYPGFNATQQSVFVLGTGNTALLFNSSLVILGICLIGAAYFIERVLEKWQHSIFLLLLGIGAIGTGVFSTRIQLANGTFALLTFVFAPFVMIYSYRIEKVPLNYVALLLGLISLLAFASYVSGTYLGLGVGGTQLLIVYPVMIWGFVFSGHLITGTLD